MVVGGGENEMRKSRFSVDQLLDHAEAVEAGHLHVEKNQIGRVFLDQGYGLRAVFALADQAQLGETF